MDKEIKDFYQKTIMDFSVRQDSLTESEWPENWVKIFYKVYPRFSNFPLKNYKEKEGELIDLLRKRSSKRDFINEPISREELDSMIYFSIGIKDLDSERSSATRRFYPSGGARYPVEGYLISNNISGLERGLFHYNSKANIWEYLLKEDLREESTEIFGKEITLNNPNFLIMTGVMSRSEVKYGIHAYRFALLEAGHIGQNIALLSSKLGIGSCPLGGFDNKKLTCLLDLPEDEIPLYSFAIGKTKLTNYETFVLEATKK